MTNTSMPLVRPPLQAVAVLCVLAVAARSGAAQVRQDSTRADTLSRTLNSVIVTSGNNPAITGGAASVAVSPMSLNVTPAPLLQEVLREMPFILVRQNSRGEMEISSRGSDSRQVAVMLDGLPLTLGWDNRSDPSLIPTTGVQSLRFVRGLSSVLNGPNVLGGLLELDVASSGITNAPPQRLMLGSGIDIYGARVASVLGGHRMGDASRGTFTIRGGAGVRESDGFALADDVNDPTAADHLRTNTYISQQDAFASARWQARGGAYLGATATGYTTERGVAPELHVSEPRFWKYPNQSRALAILSAGTGLGATPFGYGGLDVSAGYNRGTVHIASYTDATYSTLDSEERGDERLANVHLRAMHSLPLGARLAVAFTGGRVQYTEILDDAHTKFEQRLWSTGAEVELPVTGTFALSGGVVNDASTTPESGGRTPLPRRSAWGWRGGASLALMADRARVHVSVSERSRFPALRELYSGALNRFEPNPALRPETLLGAEVGFSLFGSQTGSHVLSFQSVVFHHNLDDAVVRTTLPNNRFFRVNRDEIESTGLEFFGSIVPRERGISLSADLLLQDVNVRDQTIPEGERRAEHQPALRAKLDLGAPLPLELNGAVTVRHVGKQFCANPDAAGYITLGSQTVGDLAVNRTFRLGSGGSLLNSLRAVLALDNVTDRAVYDQCGLPQPGRTLRIGIQVF